MDKNLKRLEFDQILIKLEQSCATFLGKKLALLLLPSYNKEKVVKLLDETNMALSLINKNGNLPIYDFNDIEIYIKHLESGNFLSAKAILDIGEVLKLSRTLKQYFNNENIDQNDYLLLSDLFNNLYNNENIENKIFSSIIDENTIDDNASKVLSTLRRNRKNIEQSVREKLNSFIHSSSYSKYLMDNIITIRNNRFVIPVKSEYRDKINGVILDTSSSGSTLYIEPTSVYELNNKINNIKIDEAIEIEKILQDLCTNLFPITENLRNNYRIIGQIDLIFSKAKLSKALNGIKPIINNEKNINLIGARHPLIDGNKVVPIDVSIGENYSTLLITGPNTGGKTATLKTVGLLCNMAYSGILIPAKEDSSIYVFDNIFADIGDEQSIEQSLSTFSSHIKNIKEIIENSSSNSLILLDELGSGTDPIEGSSLAISILDYLHKQESLTIVTSHYTELKQYALVTDGFENASSDFDTENLKPTYKLLIGVPGKSNAFDICKSLGFSEEILDNAKNFIKTDSIDIETLLKNIYDNKLKIEQEKETIEKNLNQIELLRKSLERDNKKLDDEAANIISDAKQKALNILLDAKEDANDIIKDLNQENISLSKANSLRNEINSKIDNLFDKKEIIVNDKIKRSDLYIGQNIFINKLKQNGTILSLPNKNNEVLVQIGIMKMNVSLNDISLLEESSLKNNKIIVDNNNKTKITFNNSIKSKSISSEINVIGLNVEEAISIIDKYIDDAYLSKLINIRIVHGKGTGKLREGIHKYLKTNSHVQEFRIGTFGEGEMGVTIVTLKK